MGLRYSAIKEEKEELAAVKLLTSCLSCAGDAVHWSHMSQGKTARRRDRGSGIDRACLVDSRNVDDADCRWCGVDAFLCHEKCWRLLPVWMWMRTWTRTWPWTWTNCRIAQKSKSLQGEISRLSPHAATFPSCSLPCSCPSASVARLCPPLQLRLLSPCRSFLPRKEGPRLQGSNRRPRHLMDGSHTASMTAQRNGRGG